ncbi:claudin domain-containing protein 1-like [Salvelinus fontinalis]|uniref:claudin domain-containing protein 1-like n=1 Tax=Salvelinus fontinalis TaxID=8038 RepID=UPI0024862007|nr:claudin domain-containing protein 1-like [Salvelinus fontinalis]XP_055764938.1 claudin domain-containing protein 1-like [Salvelinus fontinalis]XP_055764939.1 claudin domain-containing protein 1-like [Salvelinus fontinalis]XP_055764940.1 claudin domain-containing protein 1-like [Salvelinus fontinalis]
MVDNRYATALVIGSVLSLLATVYLSVAVGTQHWYQYRSPPGNHEASNASELREDFINGEFDEKAYSDTLFRLNGTLGLWWRCVQAPGQSHWFKEPDPKMVTQCVSFTLPQQFLPKYKEPGNHNTGEDLLRTYLWRCQFLLPLVSLAFVFLSGLVGVCACLCRSITPTLAVGVLHLLAGLCSLGTVCCFLAGMDLLHRVSVPPDSVDGSLGWSLYLALISSPLQMMAAALFLWAARSHRQNYTRMTAYRVA